MCSMNDFDQPLPSSFSSPLHVDFWMQRAAARAMELLTTPPSTLSKLIGPTFVPADEQSRLGEQVVHGGDALTE